MALTFAGQRRNVDLGSVRRRERVSSPLGERTGDNGCPEEAEEGNDVRMHSSKCMHRAGERGNAALPFRQYDASFAWSSDPCTSIATATSSGQLTKVARSNRYRGRANLGNQEEPAPGSRRTDDARLAASHRFRKGEGVAGQKRKSVTALVPARIVRAPGSVPVRRSSCRSRQATSGPKYTRQTRTKKCGQGRANGGLGRGERRRSNVGERVERNDESHLGSSRTQRLEIGTRPRVT
jgi:hypothetical protein